MSTGDVGAAIGVAVVVAGDWATSRAQQIEEALRGAHRAAADQKGGFAMQCDKNEYRGILAGLEGVSGKKAIDSDAMTVKN